MPTWGGLDYPFRIEGRPLAGDSQSHGDEQWVFLSPDYFRVLGIPLQRGRLFTAGDTAGAPPVLIVNAAMANNYWPDRDPIGQQITIGVEMGPAHDERTRTIVGIVGDVHQNGLGRSAPPVMYQPAAQLPDGFTRFLGSLTWMVRTAANPLALTPSVQRELLAVDGQLPTARVRTLEQDIGESIARQRFNSCC